MATYKVIQDIEAEDKLIGPLTMKQFIFAGVAAAFAFTAFMVATRINIYAAIPFIPFILVPGVLAAPLGRDQPTEIWLAAQIRFLIKPRKRIWDQSGIKELVTITAPKKVQKILTKGFSEQEVKSRLSALADTIDSRGWAIKNVDLNLYSPPSLALDDTDRLVDLASLPQIVPDIEVRAEDDIMDYQNNPVAQHFDEMVHSASQVQREYAINRMKDALKKESSQSVTPTTPSVINDTGQSVQGQTTVQSSADEEAEEKALLKHIKEEKQEEEMIKPHHKTIKTPKQVEAEEKARQAVAQAQVPSPLKNPAIIEYANTNDLSVESIAHLANRKTKPNDEVVVHLR